MHLLRAFPQAYYSRVPAKWKTARHPGGGKWGKKELVDRAVKGKAGAEGCEKVALGEWDACLSICPTGGGLAEHKRSFCVGTVTWEDWRRPWKAWMQGAWWKEGCFTQPRNAYLKEQKIFAQVEKLHFSLNRWSVFIKINGSANISSISEISLHPISEQNQLWKKV